MADSEVASLLGRSEERGGFWLGTRSSAGGGPSLSSLESEGGDESERQCQARSSEVALERDEREEPKLSVPPGHQTANTTLTQTRPHLVGG